ncbi:zinc finger BED domain-containing protein RICESLEEPER 2 [Tanacetum coccineum]
MYVAFVRVLLKNSFLLSRGLRNFSKRSDNGVHQSYKKCTKNCAASVHQHSLDGCVDFWMGAENVHDEWSWRCDFCWESWLLKEGQQKLGQRYYENSDHKSSYDQCHHVAALHQGINHTRYRKDLLEVLPLAQDKIPGFDSSKPNTPKFLHLKGREDNVRRRTQVINSI